jgi:hypothetical protein|nr:MAG TPA: replication protein O [Bacteriophage sp.]
MSTDNRFIPNSFQVPNALVDDLMAELGGVELKCYLLVIRKTKGWSKEFDAISLSQFVTFTGAGKTAVINALKNLVDAGLLVRKVGARNTSVYAINLFRNSTSSESELVQKVNHTSSESEPVTSSESEHTKNNIKNTTQNTNTNLTVSNTRAKKSEKINPENLDGLVFEDQSLQDFGIDYIDRTKWSAYCKMRKAKGKNAEIKTQGTLESILKNLLKLSGGNTATASEILEQSIANTWTGLFELKSKNQQVTTARHDEFADNGTWAQGRTLNIPDDILPEALRDE